MWMSKCQILKTIGTFRNESIKREKRSQTSYVNVNTIASAHKIISKIEWVSIDQSFWTGTNVYSTISTLAMDPIQKCYHDYHQRRSFKVFHHYRKHCIVVSIQNHHWNNRLMVAYPISKSTQRTTRTNKKKESPKRSDCFYVVKSVLCFGILYNICMSVCRIFLFIVWNPIWFHFTVEPLIVY